MPSTTSADVTSHAWASRRNCRAESGDLISAHRDPFGVARTAQALHRPLARELHDEAAGATAADLVAMTDPGRIEDDRPGQTGTRASLRELGQRSAQHEEKVRQLVRVPREPGARRVLGLDELQIARLAHGLSPAVKLAVCRVIGHGSPGNGNCFPTDHRLAHGCGTAGPLWHTPVTRVTHAASKRDTAIVTG